MLRLMTSHVRRIAVSALSVACLALPLATLATSADAAPKAKSYKNCTALHKDYPHGVAKSGAHDKVKGKTEPVTNFKVSTKVYKLNDGKAKKKGEHDLDRDNDGVACEKH